MVSLVDPNKFLKDGLGYFGDVVTVIGNAGTKTVSRVVGGALDDINQHIFGFSPDNLMGKLLSVGVIATLAGVGIPAAGITLSIGMLRYIVGRMRSRPRQALEDGRAGGCIRRNARSGGGGTKRKKIKTKIVKSKKRRLIYFTRRRSIIKKIRRSKKN
jgi:hypothetical protein